MRAVVALFIAIGFVFNLFAAQPTEAQMKDAQKVAQEFVAAWKASDFDKAIVLSESTHVSTTAMRVAHQVTKYIEITDIVEIRKPEVLQNEFVAIELILSVSGIRNLKEDSWWLALVPINGHWKVCYSNPSNKPQKMDVFKRTAATKQEGAAAYRIALEKAKKDMAAIEEEKRKEQERLAAPPPTEAQLDEAVKVAHEFMEAWKAGDYDKAIVLTDKGQAVGTAYVVARQVTKESELTEVVEWKKPEVHRNEFASIQMVLTTTDKRGAKTQNWWIALVPIDGKWKVCYLNPLNKPQGLSHVKRVAAVREDALPAYNNGIKPKQPAPEKK